MFPPNLVRLRDRVGTVGCLRPKIDSFILFNITVSNGISSDGSVQQFQIDCYRGYSNLSVVATRFNCCCLNLKFYSLNI